MDNSLNQNNQVQSSVPQQGAPVSPQAVPPVATAPQQTVAPQNEPAEITADAIRQQLQSTLEPTPAPTPTVPEVVPQQPVVPQEEVVVQSAVQEEPVSQTPETPSSTAPVTIYTIETCPYSKAEKDYLQSKGISYNEKRVDTDEAALKEMLAVSDNFAGVPVSVIQGVEEKRVVKGFTQSDFENELRALGLVTEPEAPSMPAVPPVQQPESMPVAPAPVPAPVVPEVPPAAAPVVPDFGTQTAPTQQQQQ